MKLLDKIHRSYCIDLSVYGKMWNMIYGWINIFFCSTTAKSCEPCGTYAIPYPLSTGPNCGDPMHNNFNCDKSTGNVSFTIPGGKSYPVAVINEDTRTFFIQTDDLSSFDSSFRNQNSTDFPFNITDFIEDVIKINWRPVPERHRLI